LLSACPRRYRPLIATALYTGMRTSELVGLVWGDVALRRGTIHVSAQLSRAHREVPARRVPPKTTASVRDVPLVPQLAVLPREQRRASAFATGDDWVFSTRHGTPLGHRNVERLALNRAARIAGLNDGEWPPLRFHDLRHTFASHLILGLGLDVAQVSRILGHSRITTTLDVLPTSSTRPATRPRSVPGWRRARLRSYSAGSARHRAEFSWLPWQAATT
jgi:integrase